MDIGRTLQCILLTGAMAAACATPEPDLPGQAPSEPEAAAATPEEAAPDAIRDTAVSHVIPAVGGTVVLPGIMTLHFPAGAFAADTRVTLLTTRDEDAFDHFISTTSPGSPPAWVVVAEVMGMCPAVPVTAEFVIPVDYRTAVDTLRVRAFAALYYSSEFELHDTFEALTSAAEEGNVLRAELPPWAFSDERSAAIPCDALFAIASERIRR